MDTFQIRNVRRRFCTEWGSRRTREWADFPSSAREQTPRPACQICRGRMTGVMAGRTNLTPGTTGGA